MHSPLLSRFVILCAVLLANSSFGQQNLTTLQLSASTKHALALRSDGTVWAWGTNQIGELGITNSLMLSPKRIPVLTGVSAISAGPLHSLAVSNGIVWAWGTNGNGRLGNGNTTNSTAPVKALVVTNAIGVAAGINHSLAVLSDGRVFGWGNNDSGQLGTGNGTGATQPTLVNTLTNAVAVGAGTNFSVALTASGEVWTWGTNAFGQLGLGNTTSQTSPTKISGFSNVIQIAVGGAHCLALKADGSVFAWGRNTDGQGGNGSTTNVTSPTVVLNIGATQTLGTAKFISANMASSCAVLSNGGLFVWGSWFVPGTNGVATSPMELGMALDKSFYFASYGDGFLVAAQTKGSVWSWGDNKYGQWGNGTASESIWGDYEMRNPTYGFSSQPNARTKVFLRGQREWRPYNTFVLPDGLDKGVELGVEGSELYNYVSATPPWFLRIAKSPSQHPLQLAPGTTNIVRFTVDNPVVAFGSEVGGSPLYTGQPYTFSVFGGAIDENTNQTGLIRVSVYDKTTLSGGGSNVAPTNTFTISIPRRFIAADNANWQNFISSGQQIVVETNGLRTVVELTDGGRDNYVWGLSWFGGPPPANAVLGGYRITQTASSTNYCYVVEVKGSAHVGTALIGPMATNNAGWAYLPMYAMSFEQFPQWRSQFIDHPHFRGIPLPPQYAGRPANELNAMQAAPLTNIVTLTNNSAYLALDGSAELRRHPVLDQLVLDLGKNPLALASYVLNEIEFCDPVAFSDRPKTVSNSVEPGGISRSALATLLEGEGSPTEQCALLIYLLRQAGYSAGYAFATNGNIRLTDTRISQLWQIQVSGLTYLDWGTPVLTNNLISVSYPWVVANIGTNCVHIFPWLKDTEIVQGLNVYNYLPTNYSSAYPWVKDYLLATPTLLAVAPPKSPALAVWKAYLQGVLNTSSIEKQLSLDDMGVRAYNRRRTYTSWESLPRPSFVTNQTQMVTVPTLSESVSTYPFLTNIFDRVRVQVYKTDSSVTNNMILDSGDWKACDLHNRKMLVYTNGTDNVALWLAAYRPGITTVSNFTNFETGTNSLNIQLAQAAVASSVTNLIVKTTYTRRALKWAQPSEWLPFTEIGITDWATGCHKEDMNCVTFSVGRVTPAMVRVHADSYWQLEQQRAANPSLAVSKTEDVGTMAMLLAGGYLSEKDAAGEFNSQIHAVKALTRLDFGVLRLRPLANGKMQVVTDISWNIAWRLGNASLRQEAGESVGSSLVNFVTMSQLLNADAEHSILRSMFGDNNAISSVRLIQIAAELGRSNNIALPFEVNVKNYQAVGNTTQTGYPSPPRTDDPSGWSYIDSQFSNGPDTNFLRVITVPGRMNIATAGFVGSAAIFFDRFGTEATLVDNDFSNGGQSSVDLYWSQTPATSSYDLTYSLNHDSITGYSFTYNDFSTPSVRFSFSFPQLSALTANSGVSKIKVDYTPQQQTQGGVLAEGMRLATSTSTASAIRAAKDFGYFDKAKASLRQYGSFLADPIELVNGEFVADSADLTLAGPLPFSLRRIYQSRNLSDNQFGVGWKMGPMPWLVTITNAQSQRIIYAADSDGAVLAYRNQTNLTWKVMVDDNPSLVNFTATGIGSTSNPFQNYIQQNSTNNTIYVLFEPNGNRRTFQELNSFAVSSGTNVLGRIRPYLTRFEDHAGNYIDFAYGTNSAANDYGQVDRIQAANGAFLVLKYDALGRVVEAFTDDERRATYEYDRFGDLVTVHLPDSSTWQYEYEPYTFTATNGATLTDSKHLLTKETKPDGRMLANAYDSYRRVITQAATVGASRALVTNAWLFYTNNINSLTNEVVTGATRLEDVFHNAYVYYYTSNLITRIEEPLSRVTLQDWFDGSETNKTGYYQRSVEQLVDARGLTNQFRYDTNGNVTNRIASGDLTGEGFTNQTATTTFTYTNNLLASASGPTGLQRAFFYEDTDSFRPTRFVFSSGATSIATNRFTYTNVTETVDLGGGLLQTNRSSGLVVREITADVATNDWVFNGRGFPTTSVFYARTAEDTNNVDPAVVTRYVFTPRGDLSQVLDASGRGVTRGFDAMGRALWRDVSDEMGNVISHENFYFNRNGDLEWYDGPRSNPDDLIWFDYDGAGRKIQEVHWRSRAKSDGSGVEAETGDALYATTSYQYDGFGNLTNIIHPRGCITTNGWDALGRLVLTKTKDIDGSTLLKSESFGYEAGGLVRFHTNALGGVTEIQYTSKGQPKFRIGADNATNRWTYYLDGRVKREYAQNGAFGETTYSDAARTITQIFNSPAGTPFATNVTVLDRRGNVVAVTDASGATFTSSFDGLNRLKTSAGPQISFDPPPGSPPQPGGTPPPMQQINTVLYDAAGLAVTNVNGVGNKFITYLDALGRATRREIRDSSNTLVREQSIAYAGDQNGYTITDGSGSGAVSQTVFTDTEGNPVLDVSYPAVGIQQFAKNTFDVAGNLILTGEFVRTNSTVTQFASASFVYDGLNRLIQKYEGDGAGTFNYLDGLGNVTNQVLPGGLRWNARYTAAGLMTTNWNSNVSNNVIRANSFTYYTSGPFAGLLSSWTDARSVTNTFAYDDWLRTATNTYTGALDEQKLTTAWTYDARGLLTNAVQSFNSAATGPQTKITRSYDPYGQLSSESVTFGTNTVNTSQSFDAAGRRFSVGVGAFGFNLVWRADELLAGVDTVVGDSSYEYDTAGLLTNRVAGVRRTRVVARDGAGRTLSSETKVNGSVAMTEAITYTGDGLIDSHEIDRNYVDLHSYTYAPLTRRVTQERLNLNSSSSWTNTFTYDNGGAQGAGVLTRITKPGTGGADWMAHLDAFNRVDLETNNVVRRLANGRVNMQPGYAALNVLLDGKPVPFLTLGNGDTNWPTKWQAQLELLPGAHSLTGIAVHPSHQFTNVSSITFTNQAVDQTTLSYYSEGQLTQRIWKNSLGQTNRTQTFKWDGASRLYAFTERDASNNGHDWRAVYDAFGRRCQTWTVPITNNVAVTNQTKVFMQMYDPEVEFLELGVFADGRWNWKVYGPDLDQEYGGLNGVGGWDAVVSGPSAYHPLIADARGNVVGAFEPETSSIHWNEARVTAYGSVPDKRPLSLGEGAPLWEAGAWRGRYPELSGLYNLGARYYDPVAGRFISCDPLGHDSDPSLYSFANQDPVNYFDADGRFAKGSARDVGRIGNGLFDGVVRVPVDTVGMAVYSLNGNPEDFDPWSNTYTWAFRQDPDQLQTAIVRGTGKSVANVGTLGAYGMTEGWVESVRTGDWDAAQNGSAGMLLMAGGAPRSLPAARAQTRISFQRAAQTAPRPRRGPAGAPPSARPTPPPPRPQNMLPAPKQPPRLGLPQRTRNPRDAAANPKPPRPLPLNRPIGKSAAQNQQLQADIAAAQAEGATDIRVNQQQVNAAGDRVGVNKPDLQYTRPDGTRIYIEYDNTTPGTAPNTPRGPGHGDRILSNDPKGIFIPKTF